MSSIIKDAEDLVKYVGKLQKAVVDAISGKDSTQEMPIDVGMFVDAIPEWKPDTDYKKNDLFVYNGCPGYVRQPSVHSLEHQPPFSVGMESVYGARPTPDRNGIYPYVYNMSVITGTLVRSAANGKLYKSLTGTKESPAILLYDPKDAVGFMEEVKEEPVE